jgi:hypothetical protein
MAAIAVGDSNLVWQQVKIALANAHPVAQQTFDALRRYLATQGGNPQLQILPFSEADADAAGGTVLATGACKIYGVYCKKVSAATDNYVKVYDDATDDTTAGDQIIALALLATEEVAFEIHPNGLAFATGVVITQHTTSIGVTDGSDGGNGFVLVGPA